MFPAKNVPGASVLRDKMFLGQNVPRDKGSLGLMRFIIRRMYVCKKTPNNAAMLQSSTVLLHCQQPAH